MEICDLRNTSSKEEESCTLRKFTTVLGNLNERELKTEVLVCRRRGIGTRFINTISVTLK
jgi:hypothetical protein